jgi:hypothetical protein
MVAMLPVQVVQLELAAPLVAMQLQEVGELLAPLMTQLEPEAFVTEPD